VANRKVADTALAGPESNAAGTLLFFMLDLCSWSAALLLEQSCVPVFYLSNGWGYGNTIRGLGPFFFLTTT